MIHKSGRALQCVLGLNMPSILHIWNEIYLRDVCSLAVWDLQQITSSLAVQLLSHDLLLLPLCFCLLWIYPFLHTPLAIWLSWERRKKKSFHSDGKWVFDMFPWAELRGFTKLKTLTWNLHLGCCFMLMSYTIFHYTEFLIHTLDFWNKLRIHCSHDRDKALTEDGWMMMNRRLNVRPTQTNSNFILTLDNVVSVNRTL